MRQLATDTSRKRRPTRGGVFVSLVSARPSPLPGHAPPPFTESSPSLYFVRVESGHAPDYRCTRAS